MTDEIEVVPQITKTDARDLKSLVRGDYKMLQNELSRRANRLQNNLRDIRSERVEEDKAAAKTEVAGLIRRVNNLNDAIVAKMTELSAAGWTNNPYGNGYVRDTEMSPHAFTVSFNIENLIPPTRDNSDLNDAQTDINDQEHEAALGLEKAEADFIRELTLQSVTGEAARDFIIALPTPESLITAPALALPA